MKRDKQVLLLDPMSGISGDMLLGALAALELDQDAFRAALASLPIDGWSIEFVPRRISGIAVLDAQVHAPEGHHHRHLPDIERIIDAGDLPGAAAARAKQIFRKLAAAEAAVHGVAVERIHFHEVGALDAIIDIVGVSVALELLAVDGLLVTPIHVGTGTVQCAHGLMPVPAPATLNLLAGFEVVHSGIPAELVTPTGAAVLAALAQPVAAGWSATPLRSGYGAGTRTLPSDRPNLLRASIFSAAPPPGNILLLETTVDDMNPEELPHVSALALAAGALDVYWVPAVTKGGRPAFLLSVIASPAESEQLAALLLRETTSLGVRIHPCERRTLRRETRQVQTEFGPVRIKIAHLPDGGRRATPELRDCQTLAAEQEHPLWRIMEAARRRWAESADGG
jgi:uncharacterized protein (TIGR00299 family) protein